MINIKEWKLKYPNGYIKIVYNPKGEEELIIINNPPISKKQIKIEKQNYHKIELKQLSNVNLPNQLTFKHVNKKQQMKEQKMKRFMDINYLNYVRGGRKHYTYGLDNSPKSSWDKNKTEFECQRDKKPKNFEVWRNQAKVVNTTPIDKTHHRLLKYPPMMKKSPSAGIKHLSLFEADKITTALNNKIIEVVDLRMGNELEKGIQHELK